MVLGNTTDVYDLKNIADFAGVYASFEMGATLGYASKNALWLKNTKGVKLNMKSSSGEGVALSLAAEGFKIGAIEGALEGGCEGVPEGDRLGAI